MRNTIIRILYVGIILFIGLFLFVGGCHKKLVRDHNDGFVKGFVIDAASLTPISSAEILNGAPPDTVFVSKTDSTGYYTLSAAPGNVFVTAITSGYRTQTKEVTIIRFQTVVLDFLLLKVD
jgi:hypothetical protein